MPKASKSSASKTVEVEGYEGHFEDFGPYTVGFETYTADADMAPLLVGLPDDRCQCRHTGYVLEGSVNFTFADGHEDIYEAGDVLRPARPHADTVRGLRRSSSSARRPSFSRRWRSWGRTWPARATCTGSAGADPAPLPGRRAGHCAEGRPANRVPILASVLASSGSRKMRQ
jgi:prepilin-type processing-associated H-X9-DG protein